MKKLFILLAIVLIMFCMDVMGQDATVTAMGASVNVGSTVQVSGTTAHNFTSAKAITVFSLNGVSGTINETAKTITVIMPKSADVKALVATFTTTGASVKVGSTVQVSGTTAHNFTSPVTYTVTAADTTTQDYTVMIRVIFIDNPYSVKLNSYKGQLHCHTTNSDGAQKPADVVLAYKNAGFDFIFITDHKFITEDPDVPGITFIKGIETQEGGLYKHFVAYDVDRQIPNADIQTTIDFYNAYNKLVTIAHPAWKGYVVSMNFDEINDYHGYKFMEVFNSTAGIAETEWDSVLSMNKEVWGLSVDDCHDINGNNFNKGWIVLYANNNNKDEILASLRQGNFYASTGNNIKITVQGNIITASSTNLSSFYFISKGQRILKVEHHVTNSKYEIQGNELYVRVDAINAQNGQAVAWSQPLFIH